MKLPLSADPPAFEIRYGITEEAARRKGYEIRKRTAPPDPSPLDALLKKMSPEAVKKWGETLGGPGGKEAPNVSVTMPNGDEVGAPTTGCDAEARTALWGSVEHWLLGQRFGSDFREGLISRAEKDPAMRALNVEWSQCMAAKSFADLESPAKAMDLAASFYEKGDETTAFTREVDLAIADAQCENDTDYVRKRRILEDRYLAAGMGGYETEIAATRELNRGALVRARTLLAS
ncbi:hypothetical protein [Actinocorallia sp. A-T 12471]|uniref:hypothetical protein n=1 Tax=Actinocorallia sp. A-T 12471 TaxID=3089813 RepID=UPI0029D30FFF|nr:hypothetical protein [Actinocorallia sp. A-T 12471]MDX6738311.1 hypothetical protein [Actinocorallia sp. A-T 12471]